MMWVGTLLTWVRYLPTHCPQTAARWISCFSHRSAAQTLESWVGGGEQGLGAASGKWVSITLPLSPNPSVMVGASKKRLQRQSHLPSPPHVSWSPPWNLFQWGLQLIQS